MDYPEAQPIDVVGALIEKENTILIAKRGSGIHAGKWEFPGGKVVAHESHEQALKREIYEELSIIIEVYGLLKSVPFTVGEISYSLHGYMAKHKHGDIKLNFHSEFLWAPIHELKNYDLAPADIPIVEEILNHDW